MARQDQVQQELDHIEFVIIRLEHPDSGDGTAQPCAVMQPEYWRKRIHAVLSLVGTSGQVARRGAALLARLDRIASADALRRKQKQ